MRASSSTHTRSGAVVRTAIVSAALLALAACGVADIAGPGARATINPPPPHYPIIFVHGYNASSSTWSTMVSNFTADGWTSEELVNWSYDYNQSNATTAQQISTKVDSVLNATGAHHVDIVAHSMGALSARYYVRNILPKSSTKVDAVIILGGPDHGTNTAYACFAISCVEMRPGSTFLSQLNKRDETWGTPNYQTWWSPCDEVIQPQTSVSLKGATNTETACLQHSQLHEDYTVYMQVKNVVSQTRYGL